MFFNGWASVGRVLLVGTLAYVALVVLLRASGKRTLSKFNAFDLVVTIAIGSSLATVLLSKDVPLADGVAALALLVFLQFAVTWVSVRSRHFSRLVKAEPTLLFFRGEFLRGAMRRARVTEGEVRAAMREASVGSLDEVEAVVLETAADVTVIPKSPAGPAGLLDEVRGVPARGGEGGGGGGPR